MKVYYVSITPGSDAYTTEEVILFAPKCGYELVQFDGFTPENCNSLLPQRAYARWLSRGKPGAMPPILGMAMYENSKRLDDMVSAFSSSLSLPVFIPPSIFQTSMSPLQYDYVVGTEDAVCMDAAYNLGYELIHSRLADSAFYDPQQNLEGLRQVMKVVNRNRHDDDNDPDIYGSNIIKLVSPAPERLYVIG